MDGSLVSIHINPYFLRLNFTHPVLEDDASSARYDPSSGYLTVTLTKEVHGQIFDDLDLLAKLLAPRPTAPQPAIEVISGTSDHLENHIEETDLVSKTEALSLEREREEILKGEISLLIVLSWLELPSTAAENDWQLPQEVQDSQLSTSVQKYYGFLDMHSGYFRHVMHTENEVNELGADAETCSATARHQRRLQHEDDKFDEEYYM